MKDSITNTGNITMGETRMDFDELESPHQVAQELFDNGMLSADQAAYVASEVYQPLKDAIEELREIVNKLVNER